MANFKVEGFVKKTRTAPAKEIARAKRYRAEYIERQMKNEQTV